MDVPRRPAVHVARKGRPPSVPVRAARRRQQKWGTGGGHSPVGWPGAAAGRRVQLPGTRASRRLSLPSRHLQVPPRNKDVSRGAGSFPSMICRVCTTPSSAKYSQDPSFPTSPQQSSCRQAQDVEVPPQAPNPTSSPAQPPSRGGRPYGDVTERYWGRVSHALRSAPLGRDAMASDAGALGTVPMPGSDDTTSSVSSPLPGTITSRPVRLRALGVHNGWERQNAKRGPFWARCCPPHYRGRTCILCAGHRPAHMAPRHLRRRRAGPAGRAPAAASPDALGPSGLGRLVRTF